MGAVDLLLGPMLLGLTLNGLLMGSLFIQYFNYFTVSAKRDPAWLKYTVAFLMIADIVNFVFDFTFVWQYTITHFGDFEYIQRSTWVFNTDPVMTVIISTTVQSFYAWRVRKLTGHTWLYVLLFVSASIQFLSGLGTTIGCSIVKDFYRFQSFRSVVIVWLTLSAVTDIAIAAIMVEYLRTHRTGIQKTEDAITRLVRFTIQTGALTSIWAIVDLIVYLSFNNTLHLIFNMSLSKLYSNSCLSSLNSRAAWTESVTQSEKNLGHGVSIMTTSVMHHDSIELDQTANSSSSHVQRQLRHALNSRRLSNIPDTRASHPKGLQLRPQESSVSEYDQDQGDFIMDESKTENSEPGALSFQEIESKPHLRDDDPDLLSPTLTNLSVEGYKSPRI
ncbi:uncharacterized protein EI90DRAFT_2325060 [Cantharellus anzutake]|uniref:uncharacterized protein n=1 Tax=Cantharellus anzutake TaxID=1750568 RepID=UPI001906C3E4|nr:uncharacterized protein EI90DRAFT_2325060 [Cantharellus anzutake]KAF8324562.1 hypothetical protein EI90DRAFT_2325060 [Cantharellus anzutake]